MRTLRTTLAGLVMAGFAVYAIVPTVSAGPIVPSLEEILGSGGDCDGLLLDFYCDTDPGENRTSCRAWFSAAGAGRGAPTGGPGADSCVIG